MKFNFLKNLDAHTHEIIHGTSLAFVFRCLGAVLAMGFQVALARVLGAHDAGRYVLCVSCVLFASVVARLGFDTISVRFIAAHASLSEWGSVALVRRNVFKMVIPFSVGVAGVLFLLSKTIAVDVFKDPEMGVPLQLMSLAIPFWAVAALQSEMMRGLKKIGHYLFIQSVLMPSVLLICLMVFGARFALLGQSFFYVLACLLALILALKMWRDSVPADVATGPEVLSSELLSAGLPMLWVACASYMNTWVSTIILGSYGNPSEVAVFNAASRLALAPGFLLISVNSILAPKFSAIYKSGAIAELESVAAKTTRILFLLVLPVLAAMLVFPKPILGLFGAKFAEAAWVLRVLVVGQMIGFMTGFAGQLLLMTGHEKDLRNITTVTVIFNLLISYVFIFYHQTIGAAYASVIVMLVTSVLLVVFVRKRLNISAHLFSRGGLN